MGNVSANGAEAVRSPCGVPDTGYEVEGGDPEGRFVAGGGGGKIISGRRDTTAPDLLGQEAGDSGVMGSLTAYL